MSRLMTVAVALCLLCTVAGAQGGAHAGILTGITYGGTSHWGWVKGWAWPYAGAHWSEIGEYQTTIPDNNLRWVHPSLAGQDDIEVDTLTWYVFRAKSLIDNQMWFSELSEPVYYKQASDYITFALPLTSTTSPGDPVSHPAED